MQEGVFSRSFDGLSIVTDGNRKNRDDWESDKLAGTEITPQDVTNRDMAGRSEVDEAALVDVYCPPGTGLAEVILFSCREGCICLYLSVINSLFEIMHRRGGRFFRFCSCPSVLS